MTMQALVDLARERGGLGPDDLVAVLDPLFGQVIAVHAEGLVAPLRGIGDLEVDDRYRVRFDPAAAGPPLRAEAAVSGVEGSSAAAVEVVGGAGEVERPVLVAGWQTWEHRAGHHDELTDVASLGLLLVALACGFDLARGDDAGTLAEHRHNLFAVRPDLHPVIAQLATAMIEPDRHERLQDLPSARHRLETYRDQPLDFSLDRLPDEAAPHRQVVLETLRDRLFDLSRRNRLLHFRSTQQSLNLTEASVPLLLDARNIRPEQLCTWTPDTGTARKVLGRGGLALGSVIRWDDAPYAAGVLDGMIAQARRDRSEYGQGQLRLIVAFLRWHDLKNAPSERVSSPLLLLPAELTKHRGIRDSYRLAATGSVAEVNPALRQQLERLYGLDLPETVDLADDDAIAGLNEQLVRQIAADEPGVRLTVRDRPRVELIHQRAKLRFDTYQRRAGRAATSVAGRSYAYSYRPRDRRPLGVQIFRDLVAAPGPSTSAGRPPAPRVPGTPSPTPAFGPETHVVDGGAGGSPYTWEIDLCAVTVANLNYRTMSLVRDYHELLADPGGERFGSTAFDRIFSRRPRPLEPAERPVPARADRHLVVPADGSQVAAVARAREGGSFVVQGPPGTGKSQTITNLIADYVARGQRVLFVCQKRAAIDVVHARLRAQGLDELTCLIHDSQADKKQFVLGLGRSYEAWLAAGDDVEAARSRRDEALLVVETALAEVERYEQALAGAEPGGPSLRTLVGRLIDLAGNRWGDDRPAGELRLLPGPAAWWAGRPALDAVSQALAGAGHGPVLAESSLRFLAGPVLGSARPGAEVAHRSQVAAGAVRRLLSEVGPDAADLDLGSAAQVVDLARTLAPIARRGRSAVLRRSSAEAEELTRDVAAWHAAVATRDRAATAASGWHTPPAPDEAEAALAVARRREKSFLRVLFGDWRRVRSLVATGYRGPEEPGPALALLVAARRAESELATVGTGFAERWGHPDPPALLETVEYFRSLTDPGVAGWRDRLARPGTAAGEGPAERLAEARPALDGVLSALDGLLTDAGHLRLPVLVDVLEELGSPAGVAGAQALSRALPALDDHPAVSLAARRLAAPPDGLEYAVCAAALTAAGAGDPAFARFDGAHLADLVDRIQQAGPGLRAAEAALIVSRARSAFLAETAHAARSVTGMTAADRRRKQTWNAGRRVLEHEFGKVQRYRSIRELASGDSGLVVGALRPVWLMSPTSVSDTLPLDPGLFDVVIYDEASQIPVEEAVPAMHRADQVIVVGDRMQLPPTQYFSTSGTAPSGSGEPPAGSEGPDQPDDPDADDDEMGVVLDGDSFLAQSALRLPSTMLTWHYRSRFEALIAFSNSVFYENRLAVVPDRQPDAAGRPDVVVDPGALEPGAEPAAVAVAGVDALLERSISLHRTAGSVYRRRANAGEAAYVAELIREFLARDTGLTVGIVAFSQAQQGEIERALERLAGTDDEFARRYEAELARRDGEQAVGLFVKNLENVQGDERDVIVLSICYAPGPTGRMLMNFGPINQKGGAKRLNVIVSRARQHMAVVSSIEADAITNTYNDGADTLRRFLAYAAATSRGDTRAAAAALGRAGTALPSARAGTAAAVAGEAGSTTRTALAAALRAHGLDVTEDVGRSAFRVDLALRRPEDSEYRVAVLLDTAARVGSQPLEERLTSNPAVLAGAGWRVVHVLQKDWHDDPDRVVEHLLDACPTSTP